MKTTLFSIVLLVLGFTVQTPLTFALTASPVKVEVTGDAGQTLHGEIELVNEQSEQKTLYTSFENFEPAGDTGAPRFIGSAEGLATWMKAQTSVTLDAGQKIIVPYSITIPTNAEPGGYFAAIFFGEQDPETQKAGEVSIGGKLGILILLRVSGDIVENAGISEYTSLGGNRFFASLPVNLTYRFSNSGGDRVVPLGDIVIKNTFGFMSAEIPANLNEGSVLPNSSRKFQALWGTPLAEGETHSFFKRVQTQFTDFHFGFYRAHLSVVYGTTNQPASEIFSFFIIPWQLLLVVLGVLIVFWFFLRTYNSWIVARSRAR